MFDEAFPTFNQTCLEVQTPDSNTSSGTYGSSFKVTFGISFFVAVIANLTDFDRFVIGEVMAADGRFDHFAMRSVFSYGISGKWGYGDLLSKYCNRTASRCVRNEVLRAINRFLLKAKFFQR